MLVAVAVSTSFFIYFNNNVLSFFLQFSGSGSSGFKSLVAVPTSLIFIPYFPRAFPTSCLVQAYVIIRTLGRVDCGGHFAPMKCHHSAAGGAPA